MNKMFTVWASLAALIVAAPIGKAHATDTPKFADILDSNFESASYSFNGGFDSGAMLEVGFTKNGAILQPAGAIQPVWTSERDNGRVVLRSIRDMGWLITVAPNSNALLMTPAGRVAGTGNCR
jgi:hypothetical protein